MNWTATYARLKADKGQWSRIARATGLHINAIRKIVIGETPNPRIDTVEKIVAYYEALDARGASSANEVRTTSRFREAAA